MWNFVNKIKLSVYVCDNKVTNSSVLLQLPFLGSYLTPEGWARDPR